MCVNKIPARSFPGPTWRSGKEIQPDGRYCRQKPLRVAWLCAGRRRKIRHLRIESCAVERRAKPPSRRLGFWAKPSFIHDLFYPFYRRLEFCTLLNSGYLA